MNRKSRNRTQQRSGALAIEVALCLPILLTVLFGCYEMAHANMLLHATESAAYEGARVGIVPGATKEKISTAAGQMLNSVGIRNFTIQVTPDIIESDTQRVNVQVIVPFRANTLLPSWFVDDPQFRGECELSREIL